MAFFRTVSLSDPLPAVTGNGIVLRAPQMSDCAEWVALREASRDFLTPWEPTWPADDLTRASFRRRIKRYAEDQRGDLAYAFFIFREHDDVLLGGLTLANMDRSCMYPGQCCLDQASGENRFQARGLCPPIPLYRWGLAGSFAFRPPQGRPLVAAGSLGVATNWLV